jgi:hypothetical protein
MSVVINGTTGITNDGGYTGDGVVFADTTPANTLVTGTSGNVGIGTNGPVAKVHVVSTGAYNGSANSKTGLHLQATNITGGFAASRIQWSFDPAFPKAYIEGGTYGIDYLAFSGDGSSEDARIDSSGNLLVGLTSAQSGIAADPIGISLYGNGSATSQGVGIFTRNSGNGVLYVNAKVSAASLINFYCNNTTVGVISSNGSTTTYGTSSDYRLKENVQPMAGALARVAALKPVTYTWKNTGAYDEGFIAHELQEVCPSAVSGKKDAVNEDGSIKPQSIDTSFLVATLTAAIQEQQAIITALTARVEALDARLISLEGTQP